MRPQPSPLGRQLRSPALRYSGERPATADCPAHRLQGLGAIRWLARQPKAETAAAINPRLVRRQRLEAVLLLAREPLPLRRLAKLANLADGTQARTLMRELGELYDARGCAFGIECVAGGYQLLTRSKLAPWLEKFTSPADDLRLSPPAMETLAVVAYRQPVLRAEVEAIRGVQCGELLRQLMDRELLRIVGRSEDLGRPLLYGTTKRFLQVFGLQSLDHLPNREQLEQEGRFGDAPPSESAPTSQSAPTSAAA